MREREGGRGRGGGWVVGWGGSLLPTIVVAANRWSANRQETLSTILMWRGRERGREGGREGERVGGGGGGERGCYLPLLWLLIDGLPMGRNP